MWLTLIDLKTDEQKEKLERVCKDIYEKRDKTFVYSFGVSKYPWYKYQLTVTSATEKNAKSRGFWIITKTGVPNLHYKVVEVKA